MIDNFPVGKWDVIVVDPPWGIKKSQRSKRPNQKKLDYITMKIEDIKSLKILSIASENSWCFLWTTQTYLSEAKLILEGWGFNYLLTMIWEKTYGRSNGMALWGFRWNAEFILVGIRGKKEFLPKRKLIPACFQAENIRHSQKPDKFYDMIYPLGDTHIDIFARKERAGWDVWGNEVPAVDKEAECKST